MKKYIIVLFLSVVCGMVSGQQPIPPAFLSMEQDAWVDSVFQSLTPEEKIGQLIMVATYSNQKSADQAKIIRMIKEQKIGGVITMQGGALRQAKMVNSFQAASKTPLLVATDGEYGLGMRLDSCLKYPFAVTLGALSDDSLIYRMGADIGRQCKRIGIHINFAPVADVNNNPNNPVIGFRSFGDHPSTVAGKAEWFSRGLQSQQVLATAKHFPGHGDTGSDSHYSMPVIPHSREHLDSIELVPFRQLILGGIGSVMTGHLNVPALDGSGKVATISPTIIQKILQEEMGYKGLIVSDAMNMAGITSQGNSEVLALAAGVDLLEFVPDPARTIAAVKTAIDQGILAQSDIDRKCRKILMVKRWVGLNNYRPVELAGLYDELNHSSYRLTIRNGYQKALTVLKNDQNLLPLQKLDTLKIATLSIGRTGLTEFQRSVQRYAGAKHFYIGDNASASAIDQTLAQMKNYNLIIASVNGLGIMASSGFNLSKAQADAVAKVAKTGKAIVVVFGNPYVLNSLAGIENARGVVVAYQENYDTQDLTGQLIFGAFKAEGRLPVDLNRNFRRGDGLTLDPLGRFKFTLPDELGVDSLSFKKKIDELIFRGIQEHAFPGCQVFMAKDGKVLFNESYGFHTYDSTRRVANDDLYDLASVTKVSGPLPALMYLADQKKFNVAGRMSDYWPDWKGSNKQNITIADVLSHQARLRSGIPYLRMVRNESGQLRSELFSRTPSEQYPLRVAKDLYTVSSFPDYVYREIRSSSLLRQKRYVYSDMGFMIFPRIIERLSRTNYEELLKEKFYQPLGASTLTYNPYLSFPVDRIVPTEMDTLFRHELLQGFVHDEGAALLGGVSGNAGLFGTAGDLAKLMQMYLQYGKYGGERYIAESTIKEWTRRHFTQINNRRAYGFDKPSIGNHMRVIENGYPSPLASDLSFGHSGFTGTFVWADPGTGILFVFLTNRVYPTRENNNLNKLKLRVMLQQLVYEAINPKAPKSLK